MTTRSLFRLRAALSLGLLAYLLAGCGAKVEPTGYFSSYQPFNVVDQRNVKLRGGPDLQALARVQSIGRSPDDEPRPVFSPTLQKSTDASTRILVIVIPPPDWKAGDAYTGQAREQLQRELRNALYYWTGETYPAPTMFRYHLLPDDPLTVKARPVYVRTAITRVKKGFPPARTPLIAFLGLGAVSVQVEGEVREGAPDGPTLAQFAVRTRQSGVPTGGFFDGFLYGLSIYPKAYSNLYCLRLGLNECAWRTLNNLKLLVPGPAPPAPSEASVQETSPSGEP